MRKLTASTLRANIYRILDQVAETGIPVEVVRGDKRVKIVPVDDAAPSRLDRLKRRPKAIVGDPDALVHIDWSREWKP